MTVLEATVEIVKAAIAPSGQSATFSLVTMDGARKDLLRGIEEIYKKLEELEKDKKHIGHQA